MKYIFIYLKNINFVLYYNFVYFSNFKVLNLVLFVLLLFRTYMLYKLFLYNCIIYYDGNNEEYLNTITLAK